MQKQNFRNHARYVTGYHIIAFGLLTALLIGSVINLVHSAPGNLYSASLICLIAVLIALALYFGRAFALKVQDRLIRTEENFRHYLLTGKPLPQGLRLRQLIALRFASDAEFPALTQKALDGNLSPRAIKQLISNWRADYYRA